MNTGINQLSYFVRFFGGLIFIVSSILRDGKMNIFQNLPRLFKVLLLVKPTFANFGDVWDEFRDLQEHEREELELVLSIELDLDFSDPKERELLTKGLNGALNFLELVVSFKR